MRLTGFGNSTWKQLDWSERVVYSLLIPVRLINQLTTRLLVKHDTVCHKCNDSGRQFTEQFADEEGYCSCIVGKALRYFDPPHNDQAVWMLVDYLFDNDVDDFCQWLADVHLDCKDWVIPILYAMHTNHPEMITKYEAAGGILFESMLNATKTD
jgi:hypothetical protein